MKEKYLVFHLLKFLGKTFSTRQCFGMVNIVLVVGLNSSSNFFFYTLNKYKSKVGKCQSI